MEKYPSNTLKDYYDIIHSLLEALASLDGIKIKGEGAHKELIEYNAKERRIDEKTRVFLQEMRYYRNRISYEGFNVNVEYIRSNSSEIDKIINSLFLLFEKIIK